MRTDGMNNWPDMFPPMVMAPLNNAAVSAVLGFAVNLLPVILATGLIHTSTDYEIRTAANGGGALVYSVDNSLGLLGIIVPAGVTSGLVAGQTYYIRARVDTGAGSSAYSADTRITT